MDKRQYKRVMEQIQMSDTCEQRILDAVHRQEMPKRKKTITLRKKAGIAVAAAACVAAVSVFSVAAAQNTSLLEMLFPWAESVDTPETAVFTNGQIESFTVDGMDGLDITPIGVVNDAKYVYLMMRIVPSDPDFNPAERYISTYMDFTSNLVYPQIEGIDNIYALKDDDPYRVEESGFSVQTEVPESDGSYTAFYRLKFANGITFDHLNCIIGLTDMTELSEAQNGYAEADQTELMGTISTSFTLDDSLQDQQCDFEEPIAVPNDNGTGYLKHLDIQAFSLHLSGTGEMALFGSYNEPYAATITYADGSTFTPDCKNSGLTQTYLENTLWEYNIDFDKPINPEGIVSIEFGDTVIPIH